VNTNAPFNLGQTIQQALALHQQGRLDDAEKLYNRALKEQRDSFDALHLLGMLNHQRGKYAEAQRLIAAALKVQPGSVDALCNFSMVLHALKRHAEALASVDKALTLAPAHLDALNNRGNLLLDLKRPAEAIAAFDAALAKQPRYLQALVNRGNARMELGEPELALKDYDAALGMAPFHPLAIYNRGNALRALGRLPEAVAMYERALASAPNLLGAWLNRGIVFAEFNRHAEALASYDQLLQRQPDYAEAHFNKAMSLLTLGDYPRGFVEYEWRLKREGIAAPKEFKRPAWLGEPSLAGKTIVLHAEQGLGDTIMFARYVPLLAAAGAKVVLEIQPELKHLLGSLEGAAMILGRGEALPSFDLHCPLASLPLALKTELSGVPANIPYLRAPEASIEKWRQRLGGVPFPRVALVWSGRSTHVNDRNRSLAFSQLESLLAIPNVSFVSVQRELRPGEAEALAREPRLIHVGGELEDFTDTAAVLSLCDAVVSVDTSVAHLAGALGRPTLLLLPFQPDWRWTLDRETSPWYPAIKLFRQPAIGDWAGVIGRVKTELSSIQA
jgi:tetratricopeptide (TPR) repeat protein